MAPRSLRGRGSVVCLTEFTASDAVDARRGRSAPRCTSCPAGSTTRDRVPTRWCRTTVLERYGLLGLPFVLYPAITYAHKNHETLVAAFARISPSARPRPGWC